MKKIFSLVALAGMFALMSFSTNIKTQELEQVNDCSVYANAEVVTAIEHGISNSFALGAFYGWAMANCEEANEQGAELLPTCWIGDY